MKIDKTTYKDRKENQIGMTADLTSRSDKVLFFAETPILFFKSRHTNQRFAKVKEPFFQKTKFYFNSNNKQIAVAEKR